MNRMKKQHLELTDPDLEYLRELLSKERVRPLVQKRAKALMELHEGKTYIEVSQQLALSYPTVLSWAKKYHEQRLSFLTDKPRPGRPVEIDEEQQARITALARSQPPEGRARWSLRLLADKAAELKICKQLSHNQVGVILKKMNHSLSEKGPRASKP